MKQLVIYIKMSQLKARYNLKEGIAKQKQKHINNKHKLTTNHTNK